MSNEEMSAMIPAPPGIYASVVVKISDDRDVEVKERIVAFDGTTPMIVGRDGLIPAYKMKGFRGIEDSVCRPSAPDNFDDRGIVVSIISADGWFMRSRTAKCGIRRIAAWGLRESGHISPLIPGDGFLMEFEDEDNEIFYVADLGNER